MKERLENKIKSVSDLKKLAKKVDHKSRDDMILVHLNDDEIQMLDELQGGPVFNPKTKLREYPDVDPKLLKKKFAQLRAHEMHEEDELAEDDEGDYDEDMHEEEHEHYARGGLVEGIEKLKDAGRNGDTTLAHLTPEQARAMDSVNGVHFNPRTGLREYGLKRSFKRAVRNVSHSVSKAVHQPGRQIIKPAVRIAAPVAGAVVGGPLGAAAGGYLGARATGIKHAGALKSGLISGLGAAVLPAIGGQFAQTFPGATEAIGNASRATLGPGVTSFLGNALGGGGAGALEGGIGGAAGSRASSEIGRNILMGASSAGAGGAAGGGGIGSTLGGLFGGGAGSAAGAGLGGLVSAPTLALGALGLMSIQSSKRRAAKERENYNRELAGIESGLLNRDPTAGDRREVAPFDEDYIPYTGNYSPFEAHTPHQFFREVNPPVRYLAEGGSVSPRNPRYFEGEGGGQDDDIPTEAEEGGFYLPADVMSDLGDGNSRRGALNVSDYLGSLPRSTSMGASQSTPMGHKKGGRAARIPAMVSAGEYYIPPQDVSKLGKGSNKHGTSMLEKFMKNVRSHKATKNHPPKAKSVSQYMKMAHK